MALYRGYRDDNFNEDSVDDFSFIGDIASIARSQDADVRSMTSSEDYALTRYKNNWDDLDELCTELSARSALEKTRECETDIDKRRDLKPITTDTETDLCEDDSLESDLPAVNHNNNNNNIVVEKSIVPPPRKKKLAKLMELSGKTNSTHKSNSETTSDNVQCVRVDNIILESECKNSQTFITKNNGNHGTESHDLNLRDDSEADSQCDFRESSATGSRSISEKFANYSGGSGSEPEYGDMYLSDKETPSSNEIALRHKATVNETFQRSVPREVVSEKLCDYSLTDIKNNNSDPQTGITGLPADRETSDCRSAVGEDEDTDDASVRQGPAFVQHDLKDTGDRCIDSSVSEDDGSLTDVSDNDEQYNEDRTLENCTRRTHLRVAEVDSPTRIDLPVSSPRVTDLAESHERPSDLYPSDSSAEERFEKKAVRSDSDKSQDNYKDPRKTHSIYIDSSDLQNVDETLLVVPAVRRLSTGCDPPSESEDEESKEKRLRRHSAAAISHLLTEPPAVPPRRKTNRSKSVTDLATVSPDASHTHGQTLRRNRSISNRVFSAVGKLSLRVKNVFHSKPVDFYLESGAENAGETRTKSPLSTPNSRCSPTNDKLHTSKLYIEVGGDYSTMPKPVQNTQPSDVETVHSYPEMAAQSKPKSRFGSLFGFGGKRWNTISSLPKLLHLKRKSKDKLSKSDKMSTASEGECMSVASAPVHNGKGKFLVTNGRYAANAKDRIAKDRVRRYDADSTIDMPTFISLDEYRRRMEEAEYLRKLELAEIERRQQGMGKRSRSMPYLDTSEEEEQGVYNTMKSDHARGDRRRNKAETREDIRYRKEKERKRYSEPVDKGDRRRRYKRKEKYDRSVSEETPFEGIDKSTMKVDYGCDIYHFKGHPTLRRPQSTSDLNYDNDTRDSTRYLTQPRTRNSVADPEDRGRRRPLQPRDRNSIAVTGNGHPEKWKKERLPRPKSMTSLSREDSLSSDNEDSVTLRRRKGERQKQKAPQPPHRRRDTSPEYDELEDAIQKHLKHERGPLARRKIERKRSQESGSMRRLKESFMAKRIWESVYDQLVKDLSPKRSGQTVPPQTALQTRKDPDEKSSSSRTDDGYYSRCSSHSSRDDSDSKGFSRSASIDEESHLSKSNPSRSKRVTRSDSSRTTDSRYRSSYKAEDSEDEFDTNRSVAYEPMTLTLRRGKDRKVWRPTQK